MKANKEAKLHLSKVALSVVTELEGTLLVTKLSLFKVIGNFLSLLSLWSSVLKGYIYNSPLCLLEVLCRASLLITWAMVVLSRIFQALLSYLKDGYFKYIFSLEEIIFPPVLHVRFPTDFGFTSVKITELSYFRLDIVFPLWRNSFPLQKRLAPLVVLASSRASYNFPWKQNHTKSSTSVRKLFFLIC